LFYRDPGETYFRYGMQGKVWHARKNEGWMANEDYGAKEKRIEDQ
jgi:hypothetical protein